MGYYKMKQIDRARTGDAVADINEIWNDLGRPQDAILAYRDLETYKGEGYELDLTANLTRSWRLMFNYSIPKTQQADIGPGLRGYAATHLATWQAGGNNPALPNTARVRQNITDINNIIGGYTQGRTLNGTVDYTANTYTTYVFREGHLKDFALGAGANSPHTIQTRKKSWAVWKSPPRFGDPDSGTPQQKSSVAGQQSSRRPSRVKHSSPPISPMIFPMNGLPPIERNPTTGGFSTRVKKPMHLGPSKHSLHASPPPPFGAPYSP